MEKIIVENNENVCIEKIQKSNGDEILKNLCYIKEKSIILNYIYFKYFATKENYSYILNYIANNIDSILLNNSNVVLHVNMKNLTIVDIDKHKSFIQYISVYFQEKYPQKSALWRIFVFNKSYYI